jgi:hypothetical protein
VTIRRYTVWMPEKMHETHKPSAKNQALNFMCHTGNGGKQRVFAEIDEARHGTGFPILIDGHCKHAHPCYLSADRHGNMTAAVSE